MGKVTLISSWVVPNINDNSDPGSPILTTFHTQAPDVQWSDGTYYLYYSVSAFGTQTSAIGVATSSSLEYGSWTDQGATGVSSSSGDNYNAIDANVFVENGESYMNFGSFWADIFQVKMSDMTSGSTGSATNIALNTTSSTQAVEGSFLYQDSGYYYLFFSAGQCCGYDTSKPAAGDEYQIRVCRSDSVTGPYEDKEGNSCTEGGGTQVLASVSHCSCDAHVVLVHS